MSNVDMILKILFRQQHRAPLLINQVIVLSVNTLQEKKKHI